VPTAIRRPVSGQSASIVRAGLKVNATTRSNVTEGISLHTRGSRPATDDRAFAYVYVVWQDERHEFHMFKERWVLDAANGTRALLDWLSITPG
jgi:hypothetical protein